MSYKKFLFTSPFNHSLPLPPVRNKEEWCFTFKHWKRRWDLTPLLFSSRCFAPLPTYSFISQGKAANLMNGLSIHLIDRGNAFGRKDERGRRLNSGWLNHSFIFTVRARIKGKTQQELNESELLKEPSWARSVLLAPSPVFPDLTKTKINTPTPSLFMRAYSLIPSFSPDPLMIFPVVKPLIHLLCPHCKRRWEWVRMYFFVSGFKHWGSGGVKQLRIELPLLSLLTHSPSFRNCKQFHCLIHSLTDQDPY